MCVGVARVGSETQQIKAATLHDMADIDLGGPLQSLVVVGHSHPLEMDMLKLFAASDTIFPEDEK